MNKEIVVKSYISVKKSPRLEKIKHSAKAGLSLDEAIERNTIGRFKEEDGDDDREDDERGN